MNDKRLENRIVLNPKIMFGKPIIKGTRLTVDMILEKLAAGQTEDQIIESYPFLKKQDIKACLYYAAKFISLNELTSA